MRRPKDFLLIALGSLAVLVLFLTAVLLVFLAGTWIYTTVCLEVAKQEGVYATPEEGMQAKIARTWSGVERVEIEYAGPNSFDGRNPHVWFVVAKVWLRGRDDERDYVYPGSFFLRVEEGWVHVPEGAFPEFVGFGMQLFGID